MVIYCDSSVYNSVYVIIVNVNVCKIFFKRNSTTILQEHKKEY